MVQADAEWADDKFMDYYFSVTPAGSAASGLPAFQAKEAGARFADRPSSASTSTATSPTAA